MQEHLQILQSWTRIFKPIEQTRMFLSNVDSEPKASVSATLEQLRGKIFDDPIDEHLNLIMLPWAVTNHRLFNERSNNSHNRANLEDCNTTYSNQVNSLNEPSNDSHDKTSFCSFDSSYSHVDEITDTFFINAFNLVRNYGNNNNEPTNCNS